MRAACFAIACLVALGCSASGERPATPVARPEPAKPADPPKAKPAGKNVLMVIAPADFRDEELFETRKVLKAAGHTVKVASMTTQEATGMLGGKATPDLTLADARAADYDAVVFVGGQGSTVLFDDAQAHKLASDAAKDGKVLAAICLAPAILANAGLLTGRRATSNGGATAVLKAKGAAVVDAAVVEDGRIITGNGPDAAREFGEAIARQLSR
ncbi:MAG: DJ-1/PfpI family protein [Deltaproteobacteria bacterium]|nr:DJ-1/PfpI family protein [Deltaproteobacteria bacterium]